MADPADLTVQFVSPTPAIVVQVVKVSFSCSDSACDSVHIRDSANPDWAGHTLLAYEWEQLVEVVVRVGDFTPPAWFAGYRGFSRQALKDFRAHIQNGKLPATLPRSKDAP